MSSMEELTLKQKLAQMEITNAKLRQRHLEVEADKRTAAKHNALVGSTPVSNEPMPAERIDSGLRFYSGNDSHGLRSQHREQIRSSGFEEESNRPPPDPRYNFLADPARDKDTSDIERNQSKHTRSSKPLPSPPEGRGDYRMRGGGRGRGAESRENLQVEVCESGRSVVMETPAAGRGGYRPRGMWGRTNQGARTSQSFVTTDNVSDSEELFKDFEKYATPEEEALRNIEGIDFSVPPPNYTVGNKEVKRMEGRGKEEERKEGRGKEGERMEGRGKEGERMEGRGKEGERMEGRSKEGERKEGRGKEGESENGPRMPRAIRGSRFVQPPPMKLDWSKESEEAWDPKREHERRRTRDFSVQVSEVEESEDSVRRKERGGQNEEQKINLREVQSVLAKRAAARGLAAQNEEFPERTTPAGLEDNWRDSGQCLLERQAEIRRLQNYEFPPAEQKILQRGLPNEAANWRDGPQSVLFRRAVARGVLTQNEDSEFVLRQDAHWRDGTQSVLERRAAARGLPPEERDLPKEQRTLQRGHSVPNAGVQEQKGSWREVGGQSVLERRAAGRRLSAQNTGVQDETQNLLQRGHSVPNAVEHKTNWRNCGAQNEQKMTQRTAKDMEQRAIPTNPASSQDHRNSADCSQTPRPDLDREKDQSTVVTELKLEPEVKFFLDSNDTALSSPRLEQTPTDAERSKEQGEHCGNSSRRGGTPRNAQSSSVQNRLAKFRMDQNDDPAADNDNQQNDARNRGNRPQRNRHGNRDERREGFRPPFEKDLFRIRFPGSVGDRYVKEPQFYMDTDYEDWGGGVLGMGRVMQLPGRTFCNFSNRNGEKGPEGRESPDPPKNEEPENGEESWEDVSDDEKRASAPEKAKKAKGAKKFVKPLEENRKIEEPQIEENKQETKDEFSDDGDWETDEEDEEDEEDAELTRNKEDLLRKQAQLREELEKERSESRKMEIKLQGLREERDRMKSLKESKG